MLTEHGATDVHIVFNLLDTRLARSNPVADDKMIDPSTSSCTVFDFGKEKIQERPGHDHDMKRSITNHEAFAHFTSYIILTHKLIVEFVFFPLYHYFKDSLNGVIEYMKVKTIAGMFGPFHIIINFSVEKKSPPENKKCVHYI